MRKLALLAVLTAVASGCLRLEQTLTLKEDGSGTFECTCAVPEETLSQLRAAAKIEHEMARAANEAGPATPRKDYIDMFLYDSDEQIRKELGTLKKYGITVTRLKVEGREARRQMELALQFQNLADVAKTDFFKEYGFSLTKNKDGDYVLQRPPPVREKVDMPDLTKTENARLITPLLAGFFVQVKVNTPSRILRTNAHNKSTRTAVWTFDYDNKPDAFMAVQTEGLGIVFEGKGLKIPEIQPEPAKDAPSGTGKT